MIELYLQIAGNYVAKAIQGLIYCTRDHLLMNILNYLKHVKYYIYLYFIIHFRVNNVRVFVQR